MNKKLILTVLLCLFSQGIQAQTPFYNNDTKMAQITGLLLCTLLGVKYMAMQRDPGFTHIQVRLRGRSADFTSLIRDGVRHYGAITTAALASKVNNTLRAPLLVGFALAFAWYTGKVIKNKIMPAKQLVDDTSVLQQGD